MLQEYPNTVANLYPKNQEFLGEGGVGHPVSLSMFLWDTKTLAAGGEAGRVPLVTYLRCWYVVVQSSMVRFVQSLVWLVSPLSQIGIHSLLSLSQPVLTARIADLPSATNLMLLCPKQTRF